MPDGEYRIFEFRRVRKPSLRIEQFYFSCIVRLLYEKSEDVFRITFVVAMQREQTQNEE